MKSRIAVQQEPFDIAAEIAAIKDGNAGIGAVVSFLGTVRDVASGRSVTRMTLEHYPGMTERELRRIAEEAASRWPLAGVTVVHRVGRLEAGDDIVLVIAASAHRRAAFEAAEYIMDFLKTSAPFWKTEETLDGTGWVEARESDAAALWRWGRTEP
jgi:molybdopterin synthase catalytic subunit